jgi:hypothetical protein
MNRTLTTCVLLLSTIPGLATAAAPVAKISALAAATGLSERQVKMVVGAHTAYSEYRTSYDWARRRFVQVLGARRYNELMAGREIVLDNGQRLALVER